MMNLKSIRARLTIGGGIVMIVAMSTITLRGWFFMSVAAEDAARREMKTLLHRYSDEVSLKIVESSKVAATMANVVSGLVVAGRADRQGIEQFLKVNLKKNADLIGTAITMEPGDLDKRDAELGRFLPYVFHKPDGSLGVEPAAMTTENGREEWYDKPIQENRTRILVPYLYTVNGKQMAVTAGNCLALALASALRNQ